MEYKGMTYKQIFDKSDIIARDVISNGYVYEENGCMPQLKESAQKYNCSWQLIKTFVRDFQQKSHLKTSLYAGR